jgi:CRP-like cAMP-binding protein
MFKSNRILGAMSAANLEALKPHLRPVKLEHQRILFDVGDPVPVVYFPLTCVVSLVVPLSSGQSVETAMVGRDGVVGAGAALDGKISLNRAIIQLPGDALECTVGALEAAAYQSRTMIAILVRHEQTVFAQAQQSTACLAAHDTTSRLCRWLLRARDLSESDVLPFTQEFLADMLGRTRTSVSPVAHTLQQAGMIRYARGRIEILNVEGLRESACECYEATRFNYDKLLS